MRIVIVGCGKVGTTLAEQLNREKHEIVLIEKNPEVLQGVTNTLDLIGVAGNGASDAVLREAGAATADLLIAVTTTDELNLLCCLIAKKVGVRNTIARVRNPEYSQEIRLVQEDLGLSMVINPEFAAAAEIAQLLRFPSAIKIDTFAKGRVEILKLHIPAASALDGMRIRDISSRLRTRVLVCAVERGDAVEIPTGDYVLRQGDRVSIVASPRKAVEFFRKAGVTAGRVNTAMLVGGGRDHLLSRPPAHRGRHPGQDYRDEQDALRGAQRAAARGHDPPGGRHRIGSFLPRKGCPGWTPSPL